MTQFEVDPDALVAAGTVADRQRAHLERTNGYIDSTCSRFGAFSGVLSLFLGNYQETVATAKDGLADSQAVADKVSESMNGCSEDYVAADRQVYDLFEKTFAGQVDLPPYESPGTGASTPGGPLSRPGDTGAGGEGAAYADAEQAWYAKHVVDRVLPGPDTALPPWLDPKGAGKDGVLANVRSWADYQQYLEHRQAGLTPEQALSEVRPTVDQVADTHAYNAIQDNAAAAYDDAYQHAVDSGMSHQDASSAASEAAAQQQSADYEHHNSTNNSMDAAGTYLGLYEQGQGIYDNATGIVDEVQELPETVHDINEYDDYESQPEDESAQGWAR